MYFLFHEPMIYLINRKNLEAELPHIADKFLSGSGPKSKIHFMGLVNSLFEIFSEKIEISINVSGRTIKLHSSLFERKFLEKISQILKEHTTSEINDLLKAVAGQGNIVEMNFLSISKNLKYLDGYVEEEADTITVRIA
jgi:hypothetical protein